MKLNKTIFIVTILILPFSRAFGLCIPVAGSCDYCTTYRCNTGYYGTATAPGVGCVACPANATCPGGVNPSTFTCNSGYYKSSSTTCSLCPTNATCTTGTVSCNVGYYFNGSNCVSCILATGNSDATSNAGSTSMTECYLPSGKSGSNPKGNYVIATGTCNYMQ